MRILVLDDAQARHSLAAAACRGHHIVPVETAAGARHELDGERFDLALLDHDLGEEQEDGMSVVRHILGMHPYSRPQQVLVHSGNTGAAPEMVAKLRAAGVDAIWVRLEADGLAGARIVRRQ